MALIGSGAGHQPAPATPQGGPVDEYEVEINGITTTLQLTAADAEARGLKKKDTEAKAAKAPANKQAALRNKGAAAQKADG